MGVTRTASTARRGKIAALRLAAATLTACLGAGWPGAASAESIRQLQWHLDYLGVPAAQRITTGSGVTVAVIDSGVDAKNPDLSGQLVPGTCARDPGPGDDRQPTEDYDGHGTAMAGDIAAKGGGDGHALGIAPSARIMPICIDGAHIDQYVAEHEMAQGIIYAVNHGASVINISSGFGRPTGTKLEQAIGYALAHNVVVVAGAGNVSQGYSGIADVARVPGVVAVTGVGRSGLFWPGSQQGPEAAVAAPAVDITSTDSTEKTEQANTSDYATASGTSDATAIVSGVVALIRAKYPRLDAVNVINRLVRTADDRGAPGRDPEYGFGVVDPVRALTADVPAVSANPLGSPPAVSDSGEPSGTGKASARAVAGGGAGALGIAAGVLGGLAVVGAVVGLVGWRRRSRARG